MQELLTEVVNPVMLRIQDVQEKTESYNEKFIDINAILKKNEKDLTHLKRSYRQFDEINKNFNKIENEIRIQKL
jgi:hypothetical protein